MLTLKRSSYRILVVDDEPHIRQILKFTLEKAEYQVFTAADGREALEKMGETAPNLVLLDVMMPKMDGYKVCGLLKNDARYSKIPIILFTA
ncbi:MAG: response regulator, partial [Candidatus Krumholzibacteria bacterium]|nr:response regulator [Candidatus Krumholzibacteria bacterium]